MTAIVAVALAGMFTFLKPIHQKNEAVYNKRAILSAVADQLPKPLAELSDDEVQQVFDKQIDQKVLNMQGNIVSESDVMAAGYPRGKAEDLDMKRERKKSDAERLLPFYTFVKESGEKYYIISVRGNGLWDEIWGNIAMEDDLKTIAGVAFDHAAETPGLGAEIKDNPAWAAKFEGLNVYDATGSFRPIDVMKGSIPDDTKYQVDAITGATITSVGVEEMMDRGIKYYEPYFEKIKS
jgi:Na+-transporting NADH:ubiquinone oxidoreductase subunit C